MPFTAKLKNENVNILTANDPEIYRNTDLKCKLCGARMILSSAGVVRSHFKHLSNQSCVSREVETEDHLDLKQKVYNSAQKEWGKVEMEAIVDTKSGRFEIDVLIDGKYAIECQCSPCNSSYYVLKNEAYREVGLIPIWLFYTQNKFESPTNLNRLLQDIFLRNLQNPYSLSPNAFYYQGPTDKVIQPKFNRVKEENDFSPAGYVNKYLLDEISFVWDWKDFWQTIRFYYETIHS